MKNIKEIVFEKLVLNKNLKIQQNNHTNKKMITTLYLIDNTVKFPLEIIIKPEFNNKEYKEKLNGFILDTDTNGSTKYEFYDKNNNMIFILNWNQIDQIFDRHDNLKIKFIDGTYNYIEIL